MEAATALRLRPRNGLVSTGQVGRITERALFYLGAGYPVHLVGAAGTGKTTLALHVAAQLGRPVVLIHGDDEFGTSDLVGGALGFRRSKVVDNFIHSVLKTEESLQKLWVDNGLAHACRNGLTLVYDEFTRSRPEANNVLLTVLEERLLDIARDPSGDPYLRVHPDFSALFTSNPQEYAGVHKTQDALLDRMITIRLEAYDFETERAIAAARSGLDEESAGRIVRLVRASRRRSGGRRRATIRASIMLARLVQLQGGPIDPDDPQFQEICRDVLGLEDLPAMEVAHDATRDP